MAELNAQPTSIQSLYSWYAEDKLYVNRRYQRKLVWTLEEKQRLIESILAKYPVPAILIAEREEHPGTYEIIDGLQRLHAVMSFIDTAFPTLDGKYFDLKHFPTARARIALEERPSDIKVLSQKEVSVLLDYVLSLSVMRNATESEINDVFGRINTYGHRLSDQERRQAGIQNAFSDMVRTIACTLRGDVSSDILLLRSMPSISVDLPKTKHGYMVKAEDVFWVAEGILRSTDLRDSMDEQCIADIAACIVRGDLIERAKDELDDIYDPGSDLSNAVLSGLEVYGPQSFCDEFKFCVDQIRKVCDAGSGDPVRLRELAFGKGTTNAFPSLFATLLIAFHELIVKEHRMISDYGGVRIALTNVNQRIKSGMRATSPAERRKNIDVVKGLIANCFVEADNAPVIYGNHAATDIGAIIRRSEIELADYELKQGLLSLSGKRSIDKEILTKVLKTICAIANNGKDRVGKVIIGVTDKDEDAERIARLDSIVPIKVGRRNIVGVVREARLMQISTEAYVAKWRDAVRNSPLSDALRSSVLSSLDFNDFHGLGVIVITVAAQTELSYFADEVYWRDGDSTKHASTPKQIALIAKRF